MARRSHLLLALSASSFYASSSSGPAGLLRVSHALVRATVSPGDTCVDATAGNGFDSLLLSRLLFPPSPPSTASATTPSSSSSKLYCIDVQPGAIQNVTKLLIGELGEDVVNTSVKFILGSHAPLPSDLQRDPRVTAIIYNLGYLPGSADKSVATSADTTLQSLTDGISVLARGGLISCCAYRFHEGGQEEERRVREFLRTLDLREWDVNSHVGIQTRGESLGPILYTARRR